MTDRSALLTYRLEQAETTVADAQLILKHGGTCRTAVNRSYYAVFYMVLALFLKCGIAAKTSKHSGIIAMFDREFVATGKFDKQYSRILHSLFEDRQEFDYKDCIHVSFEDAQKAVDDAETFLSAIKEFIQLMS